MSSDIRTQIFNWMNSHPSKIMNMSIGEIAKRNFTTSSTVTKALQERGYHGFKHFKQVVSSTSQKSENNSSIKLVVDWFINSLNSIEFQKGFLNLSDFIRKSNHVYLIGFGHSKMICEYMMRLISNRFNKPTTFTISNFQLQQIRPNDLLIIISLDRSTKLLEELLINIQEKQKTTILISKESPKYNKVKDFHFDYIFNIPNSISYLDHHDEPSMTKAIFELGLIQFLKKDKNGS